MQLAYIWIVSHLSAKKYQNWWKFDEVLTKTNLLSFLGHGVVFVLVLPGNKQCYFSFSVSEVSHFIILLLNTKHSNPVNWQNFVIYSCLPVLPLPSCDATAVYVWHVMAHQVGLQQNIFSSKLFSLNAPLSSNLRFHTECKRTIIGLIQPVANRPILNISSLLTSWPRICRKSFVIVRRPRYKSGQNCANYIYKQTFIFINVKNCSLYKR